MQDSAPGSTGLQDEDGAPGELDFDPSDLAVAGKVIELDAAQQDIWCGNIRQTFDETCAALHRSEQSDYDGSDPEGEGDGHMENEGDDDDDDDEDDDD